MNIMAKRINDNDIITITIRKLTIIIKMLSAKFIFNVVYCGFCLFEDKLISLKIHNNMLKLECETDSYCVTAVFLRDNGLFT